MFPSDKNKREGRTCGWWFSYLLLLLLLDLVFSHGGIFSFLPSSPTSTWSISASLIMTASFFFAFISSSRLPIQPSIWCDAGYLRIAPAILRRGFRRKVRDDPLFSLLPSLCSCCVCFFFLFSLSLLFVQGCPGDRGLLETNTTVSLFSFFCCLLFYAVDRQDRNTGNWRRRPSYRHRNTRTTLAAISWPCPSLPGWSPSLACFCPNSEPLQSRRRPNPHHCGRVFCSLQFIFKKGRLFFFFFSFYIYIF